MTHNVIWYSMFLDISGSSDKNDMINIGSPNEKWYDPYWMETTLTVKSSHCATSGTRRVTLVTNNVISHEWGKDAIAYDTWNIKLAHVGSIIIHSYA
jgi:hypothetical protein